MKKYLILLLSIICFYQSYSQIDTIYLKKYNVLSSPYIDSIIIVDKSPDSLAKITKTYVNYKGEVISKLITNLTSSYDSIFQYRFDPKTGKMISKIIVFNLDRERLKNNLRNAIKLSYKDDSLIHRLEYLVVDTINIYSTVIRKELDTTKVLNRRGKIIFQNNRWINNLFQISHTELQVNESKLVLFLNNYNDTIIKNGTGFYNDLNYNLPCLTDYSNDTFFVKGKIEKGLLNGEWIGNYTNGKPYFKEQYDKGKLIKGESYDDSNNVYYYDSIFQNCLFGACENDLLKFISTNVKYPAYEKGADIQGRTMTRFKIDKEGHVKDIISLTNLSTGLENEAKRVINIMPQWNPALYRGQKVAVYYIIPIRFRLN